MSKFVEIHSIRKVVQKWPIHNLYVLHANRNHENSFPCKGNTTPNSLSKAYANFIVFGQEMKVGIKVVT